MYVTTWSYSPLWLVLETSVSSWYLGTRVNMHYIANILKVVNEWAQKIGRHVLGDIPYLRIIHLFYNIVQYKGALLKDVLAVATLILGFGVH